MLLFLFAAVLFGSGLLSLYCLNCAINEYIKSQKS